MKRSGTITETADTSPYKTRVVVYRPIDPKRFEFVDPRTRGSTPR